MAKPAVVQRKLDEAAAAVAAAEAKGTPVQQAPVVADPAPVVGQPAPVVEQVQPQPEAQPPVPQPQQGEVILDTINDPDQLKQMLMDDDAKMQTLQHKYDVLQGKYNAEVGGVGNRVRELEQQNAFLQNQLLQAQQAGQFQAQAPNAPATPQGQDNNIDLTKWYPQDVIDSYDEEYLKSQVIARQNDKAEVIGQIEPLKQQLAETQSALFINQLRASVPNYDALNDDPTFIAWLEEPVYAGSTVTRQDMLDGEVRQRNVSGIASVFAQFSPTAQAQAPAVPLNVQQQIAPQSGNAIETPTNPQNKRKYSGAEYHAIKTKITTRQMPADQVDYWKQELDAALREGRVAA